MLLTINKDSDGQWSSDGKHRKYSIHSAVLAGSLDEHTVSHLRELSTIVFDEQSFFVGDHFLIDLCGVTEIDDLGLAALVGIIVVLAAKAGSIGLILPEEHPIRRALQVTGLDKVFDIHHSTEAASEVVLALRQIQFSEDVE